MKLTKKVGRREEPLSLNELSIAFFEEAKAKGWWDKDRNLGEMLMLVTSELVEALEAARHGQFADTKLMASEAREIENLPDDKFYEAYKEKVKESFECEIADAFIRLFDLAGGMGVNLDYFIRTKARFNRLRPYRHGKQF